MKKLNLCHRNYSYVGWGYVSIAFLIFALIFTSCKGFMNAGETQNQIEAAIAYANAHSYTIKVENSKNHGNIVKPAAGETSKKVTDVFEIKFEAYSDYEFIKWEVKSSKLPEGESIYDYISFEDEKVSETKVTFLKALEEIVITPVTAERAHIISYSPMTTGVIKNSTIVVLFDHDMSEDSVYYTTDEIAALKKEYSLTDQDFLPQNAVIGQTKVYGYTKNGETFYKNVTLVNNKTGKNIAHLFDAPVFENSRTLVIATKDSLKGIDDFTQVLVTIEKGIFYEQDGKFVEMAGIKRWMYQVSTKIDDSPLGFQQSGEQNLCTSDGEFLTKSNSFPDFNDVYYLKDTDDKINLSLDFMLQDVTGGSGPTSNFTLYFERVKESDYATDAGGADVKTIRSIDYQNFTSDEAIINDTLELELPKEGLYRIWFDFPDRSNNHFYWPKDSDDDSKKAGFYIARDTKPVVIPQTRMVSSDSTTYTLNWDEPSSADYKEAVVSFIQSTGDSVQTISKGTNAVEFLDITRGSLYTVSIVFKDFAGHETAPYIVPAFETGISVQLDSEISDVVLSDDYCSNYGIIVTAIYSDGSEKNVSKYTKISESPSYTKKEINLTFTKGSITKKDKITNQFYVAASNALTQHLEKMPEGYGRYSDKTYYKFGDFPQTEDTEHTADFYNATSFGNAWFIGRDCYFYEKITKKVSGVETDFYFKVEPVTWRKVGNKYGGILLVSEKVLTESVWNKTSSNNNYKDSDIRNYLTGDFMNTVFTRTAQDYILITTVDNSVASTTPKSPNLPYGSDNNNNVCDNTNDKVFLLSIYDVTDSTIGFSDSYKDDKERLCVTTEYAQRIGVSKNSDKDGVWWLRSPSRKPKYAYYVNYNGYIAELNPRTQEYYVNEQSMTNSNYGIVPAICVDASLLE